MWPIDDGNFDLSHLPAEEDDEFEFKSSLTPIDHLKDKLIRAASGFANSGGGIFIAGVDNNGNADGGFPEAIGRLSARAWLDQVVHQVEPPPLYQPLLIRLSSGRGTIDNGKVVVAVQVAESSIGPHMATDRKYYIRAGAHTVAARHFIVNAIFANRHFGKPRLVHRVRTKPNDEGTVQLGVIALTDAPAVNVAISFSPVPQIPGGPNCPFPMTVGVIDRNNPYFMDMTTDYLAWNAKDVSIITLTVSYRDMSNNQYEHKAEIDLARSIPQGRVASNPADRAARALEEITRSIEPIARRLSLAIFPTVVREQVNGAPPNVRSTDIAKNEPQNTPGPETGAPTATPPSP